MVYWPPGALRSEKHHKYGHFLPPTMLPFVVEHEGGINKEGMECFRSCRQKALNTLVVRETAASTWSNRGLPNVFLQSISLASIKGLGHLYTCMVTAAGLWAA